MHVTSSRIAIASAGLTLAVMLALSGCVAASPSTVDPDQGTAGVNTDPRCAAVGDGLLKGWEQSSTGNDHPDNYRVTAAPLSDLTDALPTDALRSIAMTCVFAVYSSVVESTQVTGFALDDPADAIDKVRDAVTAQGWTQSPSGGDAFLSPTSHDGVQIQHVEGTVAEFLGLNGTALMVAAGDWTLWGAF